MTRQQGSLCSVPRPELHPEGWFPPSTAPNPLYRESHRLTSLVDISLSSKRNKRIFQKLSMTKSSLRSNPPTPTITASPGSACTRSPVYTPRLPLRGPNSLPLGALSAASPMCAAISSPCPALSIPHTFVHHAPLGCNTLPPSLPGKISFMLKF